MIPAPVIEKLRTIGQAIKEAVPDLTGQVTFNCSADRPEPAVEVRVCDVTKGKK